MKTYSTKASDIKRHWHVIDAKDEVLGRLATKVATLLMGKDKAMFARNVEIGDMVAVINADKVKVTGNKAQQKFYYRHSGYPGGFRTISYETMMQTHPERIIEHAVHGMLPTNHLRDRMMRRLKVYSGNARPENIPPAKTS